MESYPKFQNEVGVPIVRIGCHEFECIGDKPPQEHPHVYLHMGDASDIVCPYCSTLFRFDPTLGAREADPAECAYGDVDPVEKQQHSCYYPALSVISAAIVEVALWACSHA